SMRTCVFIFRICTPLLFLLLSGNVCGQWLHDEDYLFGRSILRGMDIGDSVLFGHVPMVDTPMLRQTRELFNGRKKSTDALLEELVTPLSLKKFIRDVGTDSLTDREKNDFYADMRVKNTQLSNDLAK